MKKYFTVEKQYLIKRNGSFHPNAMTDEVSQHETLESALETLRKESTSILSFEQLNAQFDGKQTVLTIGWVEISDTDDWDMDYITYDYYVVI